MYFLVCLHLACRLLYSIFKFWIFEDWIHTESVYLGLAANVGSPHEFCFESVEERVAFEADDADGVVGFGDGY